MYDQGSMGVLRNHLDNPPSEHNGYREYTREYSSSRPKPRDHSSSHTRHLSSSHSRPQQHSSSSGYSRKLEFSPPRTQQDYYSTSREHSKLRESPRGYSSQHSPSRGHSYERQYSSSSANRDNDGRPRHASQASSQGSSSRTPASKTTGKKFLREVQDELEDQRQEWQYEVDRLLAKTPVPNDTIPGGQSKGRNSYVDTSSGIPIFTAYVDVGEFSPKHISVNLDKITNKVIVKAEERSGLGTLTKTFTEKVNLPRFADEDRLLSHLSKKGVLKIEVPLIYYFPEQHEAANGKPAKSFVYQVKADRNGAERLEILVNTGSECNASDLRVEVTEDGKLIVKARNPSTKSGTKGNNKLLKQYTLPALADVDHITSRLGKDGRLQINVPLLRKRSVS